MSPEDIIVKPCLATRPGQRHYYAADNGFDVWMEDTTVNNVHTARWQAVHLECGAFFECHTSGIGGNATAAKVIAWDAARRHRCSDGQP